MKIDVQPTFPETDMEIIICPAGRKIKGYDLTLSNQEYALVVEKHTKKIFLGLKEGLNDNEIVLAIRTLHTKTGDHWADNMCLRLTGFEINLHAIARGLFLTGYNLGRYKTDNTTRPNNHRIILKGSKAEQYL